MKPGYWQLGWILIAQLLLTGCQAASTSIQESTSTFTPQAVGLVATTLPTQTTRPTVTLTTTSTFLPPTFTPIPTLAICSPLEGYTLDQMASLVSNPFHPPPPGSDDPHQAVDLADRQPGSQIALTGRVVQAVLAGSVAAVIQNRFPYGNALLVETPLAGLPDDLLSALGLTEPAPTSVPNLALTCPEVVQQNWGTGESLYLLYAHLQKVPVYQPGDSLDCGQGIGFVGDTGNALNPHLHLEVRLGPAGARFSSMAHYDNSATLEEMDNYCTWRVRGIFRLVDPMLLLGYKVH
jgi:murein DD-endopeptidase MepM/ murein hydrolase activator NlpD